MANNQSVVKGSCFCKQITYQFNGEPATKAVCHCSVCKRLTGSLFSMSYLIPPTNFTLTAGKPKNYKFTHPTGIGIDAAFCGDCGTWVYKHIDMEAFEGFFFVQAGTTDLEPGMEAKGYWTGSPAAELWVAERAPWLAPIEGAEQKPGF